MKIRKWLTVAVMALAVATIAYRTAGSLPHRSRAARGTGAAEGRAWVIQGASSVTIAATPKI